MMQAIARLAGRSELVLRDRNWVGIDPVGNWCYLEAPVI